MIDDAFGRLLVAVLIGAAWGRAAALHQQERGNYLPLAAWGLAVGIGAACWEMLGADSAWWWCGAGLLAALAARLLWEHLNNQMTPVIAAATVVLLVITLSMLAVAAVIARRGAGKASGAAS